MNFRKLQITLALLIFSAGVFADNMVLSVSGYIIDDSLNQPIPEHAVTIKVKNPNTALFYYQKLFTDNEGFYFKSFPLPYNYGVVEVSTIDCNNELISNSYVFSPMQPAVTSNFFVCYDPEINFCRSDFMHVADPQSGNSIIFKETAFGDINSYFWDFGDGAYSDLPDPVHAYSEDGQYEVCLQISGNSGECVDVHCETIQVSSDLLCQAFFAYFPISGIERTIEFVDASYPDMTSWSWDFGDGTTSTQPDPVHTYSETGTYTVCLTAEDSVSGCVDTYCDEVFVGQNNVCIAGFSHYVENANPTTIYFMDESTGDPDSWYWEFGDGATSDLTDPVHTYDAPGAYEVCLTIYNSNTGCQDIYCEIILVDNDPLCNAYFNYFQLAVDPHTYRFMDMSVGEVENWEWDFGDGTTSTIPNPVHAYFEPGIYNVCLTISDEQGYCYDEFCESVYVDMVPDCMADFNYQLDTVTPLQVNFFDESLGIIDSWQWDFGDGVTSDLQSPVHIYEEEGLYLVCLTIEGSYGDCNDIVCKYVQVGSSMSCAAEFDYFPLPGDPLSLQFVDLSSGSIDIWIWDFGDGQSSVEQNPDHVYETEGEYLVCLLVLDVQNACWDATCKTIEVSHEPLCEAEFNYIFSQSDPFTVQFVDQSSGDIDTWEWDFDDGTTSVLENPWHTFTEEGTFNVCLTVTSNPGNCSSTYCKEILIEAPDLCMADFEFTVSQEEPLKVNFHDLSSGIANHWSWDFGDGQSSTDQNPAHIYQDTGIYSVKLAVANIDSLVYCYDSISRDVHVTVDAPQCLADFTAFPDSGVNKPYLYHFTDLSENDPEIYFWDFGDGNTSDEQNPLHQYAEGGNYQVSLTVTKVNLWGDDCMDTKTLQIETPEYYHIGGFIYTGMYPINNPDPTGDTALVYLYRHHSSGHVVSIDTSVVTENGYFYALFLLEDNYMIKYRLTDGSANAGNYFPMYFGNKLKWRNAPVLTLSDSSHYHVDVSLARIPETDAGAGSVTGSVIHHSTTDAQVPSEDSEVLLFDGNNQAIKYTHSSQDGGFGFSQLAYGTYVLYAESAGLFTTPVTVEITENNPSVDVQLGLFNEDLTAVSELQAEKQNIRIFPNPVHNELYIELRNTHVNGLNYLIYNFAGQKISTGRFNLLSLNSPARLDVSGLAGGVYFLKVFSDEGEVNESHKFIK